MNLPYWVIAYLPKKMQEEQIQKIWDAKSDESILNAYKDANDWIEIDSFDYTSSPTTRSIADSCFKRLDNYIKPQMAKRKLF